MVLVTQGLAVRNTEAKTNKKPSPSSYRGSTEHMLASPWTDRMHITAALGPHW